MTANLFSLDGKVAFITGANSGLGRAVALAFKEMGARVAIGGRRAERNTLVLASLGSSGAAFELDVADEASVEHAFAATVERFGRVDILVNNAGVGQRASVMELDRATWQRVIDTKGPFKNYRYELAAGVQWCSSSRRGSRGDKC